MPTAHSISTLLTRNLHDVFGENDPPLLRRPHFRESAVVGEDLVDGSASAQIG